MQQPAATTVSQVTGSAGSLTAAIQSAMSGSGIPSLTAGVQRLMTAYRSGEVPDGPVMATRADAAAYAAYRMPATAAATAIALREMCRSLPGWAPASVLDLGAGTGGASWAAAEELASLRTVVLLEQSADASRLGTAIFAASDSAALRRASWRSWRLPRESEAGEGQADAQESRLGRIEASGPGSRDQRGDSVRHGTAGDRPGVEVPSAGMPAADLATSAYVLGELTAQQQASLVRLAAAAGPAVLLVEPGTPAGHRRILSARQLLIEDGFLVAAPCPHQLGCPLQIDGDWCHFGVRLQRSAVHRQIKGAELSYEDEKFSYVAAIRPPLAGPQLPAGRIVRRPQQRKGLVLLDLCVRDGASRRELVSKSKGETYRAARKASWGDRFP
jgi:ribosomal protein RSM22 (predicted rRNA methylase)